MYKFCVLSAVVGTCTAALMTTEFVDGDGEGTISVMSMDYNVESDSERFLFIQAYAIVMALLVPMMEIGLGLWIMGSTAPYYIERETRTDVDPVCDFLLSKYQGKYW